MHRVMGFLKKVAGWTGKALFLLIALGILGVGFNMPQLYQWLYASLFTTGLWGVLFGLILTLVALEVVDPRLLGKFKLNLLQK